MANPDSLNPLEEEAVILIDELNLHLHPKWQKEIVADLKRTFPKINCLICNVISVMRSMHFWKI